MDKTVRNETGANLALAERAHSVAQTRADWRAVLTRSAAEHPEIKMQSTRHEGMYQPPVGRAVVHTVRDAAEWLRCSPDAVRRAAKGAGVIRIRGNSVRGMVELTSGSRTGYLPYSI